MKKLVLFLFTIFLLQSVLINAQENNCAEEDYTAYQDLKYPDNKTKRNQADGKVAFDYNSKSAVSNMPIKAYVVRRSDGTGGIDLCDLQEALDTVNAQYDGAMYNFFICELEYIDSDTYYNIGTFAEGDDLYFSNNNPDAINIYFVDHAAGYCGWANFPTSSERYVLMQNGCTMNTSTFAHELGHYFGLYHTHQGGNELVNGSNCNTAGDLLCDTPADPNVSGQVTNSCAYIGSSTDANGDLYVPDPLNMMSYSHKPCRDFFSVDQVARMDFYYTNYREAQFNCNGSVSLCCVSDTDGDGICDDVDQCPGLDDNLIGTSCEDGDICTTGETYDSNCACTGGQFVDSDNDGVCDANDICPGFDDNEDSDNDGIPDGCDLECTTQNDVFDVNPLTHSGAGSSTSSYTFASTSQLINFDITGLSQKINGNPGNRYIELVTISYVNSQGNTIIYGSYSGANTTSVNIDIQEIALSVSVLLEDDYDGNSSQTMSVNLGSIEFCAEPCDDDDNDGVCNTVDQCPGFDDNLDSDGDGVPDGCDDCSDVIDNFDINPLTHSGSGSSASNTSIAGAIDPSVTVSGLGAKQNGNPNSRYIDEVNINYTDGNGNTFNLGPYTGDVQSSVNVDLLGVIVSIEVLLSDAYDGNANNLSVNLSDVVSCLSALDEQIPTENNKQEVNIFPVPTSDYLYVESKLDLVEMSIFSPSGNLVLTQDLRNGNRVDLSNLPTGMYYLLIRDTNQETIIKKLIKE